jgi:hypothetical protein
VPAKKSPDNYVNAVQAMGLNAYTVLHVWIINHWGKAQCCVFCGLDKPHYEWANVSGNYTRDLEDYLPLCVSCHRKLDWTENQREFHRARLKKHRIAIKSKVAQFQDGQLIQVFDCAYDAARAVDRNKACIFDALNGRQKTSAGFEWRRVDG